MPNKKGPRKHSRRATGSVDDVTEMFDQRPMERQIVAIERLLREHEFETIEEANAFLQEALANGPLPAPAPETPLEQAQDIVYQALEAKGKRRQTLARKALEVSPDCVDAYVVLADEASSHEEARRYYEQGVVVGERALGAEAFAQLAGEFWDVLETRPYMRACYGLALAQWVSGEREAAIARAREMLRLDTDDHQGIRDLLINWLFAVGDEPGVAALLAQYPDDWSATWAYSALLHTFRTKGPGQEMDNAFRHAMEVNPHVPLFLLGLAEPPKRAPAFYSMGDENEAIIYLTHAIETWIAAPDALAWIAQALMRLAPENEPPRQKRASARNTTRQKRTPKDTQKNTAKDTPTDKAKDAGQPTRGASGKRSGGRWVRDTKSAPNAGATSTPPPPPDVPPQLNA